MTRLHSRPPLLLRLVILALACWRCANAKGGTKQKREKGKDVPLPTFSSNIGGPPPPPPPPPEPTAAEALHSELSALRYSALRERAVNEGLNEDALEAAEDADDSKAALIALVLRARGLELSQPPPAEEAEEAPSVIYNVNQPEEEDEATIEARGAMARGVEYTQAGETDDAVEAFREAVSWLPNDSVVLTQLGLSLARVGRMGEALAETARAVDAAPPQSHGALLTYGSLLQNAGDQAAARQEQMASHDRYEEASAAFARARLIAPQDGSAWLNSAIVAVLLSREGTVQNQALDALQFAKQALELLTGPQSAPLRITSEKVLASANAANAAGATLRSLAEQQQHNGSGVVVAVGARSTEAMYFNEQAVACYDRILVAAEAAEAATHATGEGNGSIDQGTKPRPEDKAFPLHYRGARLENLGRYEEAVESMAESAELAPHWCALPCDANQPCLPLFTSLPGPYSLYLCCTRWSEFRLNFDRGWTGLNRTMRWQLSLIISGDLMRLRILPTRQSSCTVQPLLTHRHRPAAEVVTISLTKSRPLCAQAPVVVQQ